MKEREPEVGSLAELVQLVRRASVGSLSAKIGNFVFGLGATLVLARVLGPEQYGIYSWAFALISILAIPAKMGLTQLLVREVSAYQLEEEWGLLRGILVRANQWVLASSGLLAGLGFLGIALFTDRLGPARAWTLGWSFLLLPLMALGALRGAALRGLRRVVLGQLPELVLRPAFLLLFVGGAAIAAELTAATAMALHSAAAAVAFLIGAVLLVRLLPSQVADADAEFETRRWISSVLPLALIAGMQIINSQADIVLLGLFAPSEEVGFYRIAAKGATLVTFTLAAVNMVIAPYISRLHVDDDLQKLQNILKWSARAVLATAAPVGLILIVWGEPVLGFVFGQEYAIASTALSLLCVGQLVNVAAGPVALLLNMTGFERDTAFGVSVAASLNVILNLVLIPRYGMEGAAIATVVTFLMWNVLLCERAYRRLGLATTAVVWTGDPGKT